MAPTSISIDRLAFLTPGNYPHGEPYSGLEKTLELFELGERLGYDGAWVRQRHLEPGISSAAAFLAAATQRTSRIELGTAVIPIGYESPYRLAEDLSTVDVLARGRLNVGVSAGFPAACRHSRATRLRRRLAQFRFLARARPPPRRQFARRAARRARRHH